METKALSVERSEALHALRKYREHKAYSKPIDFEIERIYAAIAKGKVVIQALASIVEAGLQPCGLPALAIVRADAATCFCSVYGDGSANMGDTRFADRRTAKSRYEKFPPRSFPTARRADGQAIVPHIPPDIRPRRGLANYHILFEAEWRPVPPIDPMLLRRLGDGDTWLVVAGWELTAVERHAMASRIGARV